jgi:hypothetical protein
VLHDEGNRLVPAFHFVERGNSETGASEHLLPERAIEFQAVAESASPDYAMSLAPQAILTLTIARPLEDDEASLLCTPYEIVLEEVATRHDSEQDIA